MLIGYCMESAAILAMMLEGMVNRVDPLRGGGVN